MNSRRTTGMFCLFVGFLNLGMWTFLILTGQVTDFQDSVVSYLFHWTSEFLTAVLLIASGFFIFFRPNHHRTRVLYFIASGFLINAINGAFWYYLLDFNLPILVMSGLVLTGAVYLGVKNYKTGKDFILLAAGIVLYGTINLAGYGFDRGDTSLIIYTLPMLLASGGLLVFKKEDSVYIN